MNLNKSLLPEWRTEQIWNHIMRNKLEQRLVTLKSELEAGQKMLADLENKQLNVRETMLRISGAIQVLEEVLAYAEGTEPSSFTSGVPAGGNGG